MLDVDNGNIKNVKQKKKIDNKKKKHERAEVNEKPPFFVPKQVKKAKYVHSDWDILTKFRTLIRAEVCSESHQRALNFSRIYAKKI